MIQLKPLILPGTGVFSADAFEPNDTSDQPTARGTLIGTQSVPGLTIARHPDGLFDYDWFAWTAGASGLVTATVDTTPVSGNLEVFLFTVSGNTLVQLAGNSIAGLDPKSASAFFLAGQVVLVEVKGLNSSFGVMEQGAYDLTVTLS